jgi:hypothetical protein
VSLVSEIADRLSSQSVGGLTSTATWRIVYNDFLPSLIGSSSQARQVSITPSGGLDQEQAEFVDKPVFLVRVRGPSTASSTILDDKLADVETALNLQAGATFGGRKYVFVQKQGDRLWNGRDAADRPIMSQSYLAYRSRTS